MQKSTDGHETDPASENPLGNGSEEDHVSADEATGEMMLPSERMFAEVRCASGA